MPSPKKLIEKIERHSKNSVEEQEKDPEKAVDTAPNEVKSEPDFWELLWK